MKPKDANEDCVGPTADTAGQADGCNGCPSQKACASGAFKQESEAELARDAKIKATFSKIKNTILVLSGKGGVGKSTCSAQLAFSLCKRGYSVGLLDVDICGPSVPLMLGLRGQEVHKSSSGWSPVFLPMEETDGELAVMSVGFLVSDENSAIIWRGPKKNGLIEQFFTSVDWGELDFLIIDTPPGTSDEHISLVQLINKHLKPTDGAVVVSTPQEAAMLDVRKELNFCKTTKLNVLGLVENMAKSVIPLQELDFVSKGESVSKQTILKMIEKCPELANLGVSLDFFAKSKGGVQEMADTFGTEFLGSIPLDPSVQVAGDNGKSLSKESALKPWSSIVSKLLSKFKQIKAKEVSNQSSGVISK